MMGWSRPIAWMPWCAVLEVRNGSVITHCGGRWSASEESWELIDEPDVACGGCERELRRAA